MVYEQQADIEPHLEYWRGLYQREVLLMSGPFEDQSGGMFLVRVADQAAAETLVSNDPGVQASKISATIQRWRVLTSAMRNAKPVVLEVEPEQSFNIKRLDPDSPINLPEN